MPSCVVECLHFVPKDASLILGQHGPVAGNRRVEVEREDVVGLKLAMVCGAWAAVDDFDNYVH
jgi:hypothetical protein